MNVPVTDYEGGLNGIRAQFQATNRLATFFMPGDSHQHVIRPGFYTVQAGGKTMAQYVTDFINGTVQQLGP